MRMGIVVLPAGDDRIDPGPGLLDLVAMHEQRLVAADHVGEQALVGVRRALVEGSGIAQVELARHDLEPAGARHLHHELKLHAIVRLQADEQAVGIEPVAAAIAEDRMRYRLEGDGDLGIALRHAFSRAQIDRHTGPAPVVDLATDRDEGLGIGGVAEFIGIALDALAIDLAGAVLAPHGETLDIRPDDGAQRLQDLDLLVADGAGLQHVRRLDGEEGEELHEMVLHHVAHMPGLVVIAGTLLQPHRLGDGDLDMVDVAARPGALEQRVGEPQDEQVLHRLLAEIMVDPVGSAFRQDARDGIVDRPRRGKVAAERLLQDDARCRRQDIGLGEVLADRDEQVGRGREIEGVDTLALAQRLLQSLVGFRLQRIEHHHGQAAQEGLNLILRDALFIEAPGDLLRQALDILLLADDGEDAALFGQDALAVALGQRREELAQGEIAARAEDHEIEGRDRRPLGNGLGPKRVVHGGVHRSCNSVRRCRFAGPAQASSAGCGRGRTRSS